MPQQLSNGGPPTLDVLVRHDPELKSRSGIAYHGVVSPTVFRWKGYRFFFFSREETRPHVHACCPDGEAKFWLEPEVELARNHGLSAMQVDELLKTVQEKQHDILDTWRKHFAG